jgi:Asp-tRNA(Asn)/Glu-tRNA(Gln) amidotransferase A subunit family amidase
MSRNGQSRTLSAGELAREVNAGRLKARDVILDHLEAIDAASELNAFITVCGDRALDRANNLPAGPLAGVPVAVKDMLEVQGVRTTRGSAPGLSHVARRTAPAIRRLEEAGAIVIGKANQHEIAWGVTSQNSHWGDVRNPLDHRLSPGGSSGGNGAALAARLSVIGIGTDTGGSVRIPSACCATVGFKPRQASVGLDGCFPLAPTFDTIAPMARSVSDCALTFSVLSGRQVVPVDVRGIRIASFIPMPELDRFAELGAQVIGQRELPEPRAAFSRIYEVEAALAHRRWFPSQLEGYGPEARTKLGGAYTISAVEYVHAREELGRWRREVGETLDVDALITPTLGMHTPAADAHEPDIRDRVGAFTRPFSYLDWAAVAIGPLQIASPREDVAFSLALAWENKLMTTDN